MSPPWTRRRHASVTRASLPLSEAAVPSPTRGFGRRQSCRALRRLCVRHVRFFAHCFAHCRPLSMSARDFEPGAPHRVGWARPRPLTPTPNSERRAPAQPSKPTTAQLCRLPSSIAAGLVHRAEPPMPWPPRAALLRTRPQGKERVYVPLLYLVPAWMLAGMERVVEPHWRFPTAPISFRTACIWRARRRTQASPHLS